MHYQCGSVALLVLPQCLLLGAAFPLLSAGYLRITPQEDDKVLEGLYFSNCLGAACDAWLVVAMLRTIGAGDPQAAKDLCDHYRSQIFSGEFYSTTLLLYYWAEDMINGKIAACQS